MKKLLLFRSFFIPEILRHLRYSAHKLIRLKSNVFVRKKRVHIFKLPDPTIQWQKTTIQSTFILFCQKLLVPLKTNSKPLVTMEIKLFKTNVKNKSIANRLKPSLNHILGNKKWNFDLDDRDKLLRIEASEVPESELISLMKKNGIYLTELF